MTASKISGLGQKLLDGASPAVLAAIGAAVVPGARHALQAAQEAAQRAAYDALVADHVPDPPDRLASRLDVLSWEVTNTLARRPR